MLLISQNLLRYNLKYPKDTVLRFNLAWVDSLVSLENSIKSTFNDIFLDVPIGRTKPPNNNYTLEDLKPLIKRNNNIKYLAISNVETPNDIKPFNDLFSEYLSIVPKIETKRGVENISDVCKSLVGQKIVMLDHDDLFSDLIKKGINASEFLDYIERLSNFCSENSVRMLKTRGVIFSDQDEYSF